MDFPFYSGILITMETITVKTSDTDTNQRADKTLAGLIPQLSRARIQALLASGQVTMNGRPFDDASFKVQAGAEFTIVIPPPEDAAPRAQAIALDVVYEDKDLLVINKSADMVVHPGAGNHDGTLVNALLAHCGDSLSGIGGVKRPGIVHRLDKETSGLMVVAKNDAAHQFLSEQLSSRKLKRVYHAIVYGLPSPPGGRIETQIGRSRTNRKKMAVLESGGKDAITDYDLLESFGLMASLVECRLKTGRTHQIRVHMGHIGHHLVGDPVYAKHSTVKFLKAAKSDETLTMALARFPRQALHAAALEFIHPISKDKISLQAPLPKDMQDLLALLRRKMKKD
jgi:23S rRNA pseudouridine1911/1915/1917 synthase